ncbi:MAG TPA: DNA repair protein RecO [Bdellovibrionota bacterium]|jgi:DNA repair protein RecO (recombination protein O)
MTAHFQQDLGIVLRSQPYQERDRLVTVLTENHGKIGGIAKGAIHSRRFGGSLDLFACSQMRWKESQGGLVRIEEADTRRDFLRLRDKLENISAAGHFTDLCLRLTEDRQPVRDVFLLLAHYLKLLEENDATFEIVRSFEIKLLERLGWAPVLEECVSCEAALFEKELPPEQSYVSLAVEKGGFLCYGCSPAGGRHFPLASVLWMIQARETLIQHTPTLRFPLDPMLEAAAALQHFLRWHCPGLGNYHFRAHEMLEGFLLGARNESVTQPAT